MTQTQTETRAFRVSPAIIRSLIESQAGTIEKALLEGVMNSVDAGASRVNLTLDRHGYTIEDDGHGFESREMIQRHFEVFGFEHNGDVLQHSRTYGMFGIGRGQQWKWAITTYRSRRYEMHVDIRERGLDYELRENLEDRPGTHILGAFYHPLGTDALFRVRSELKNLVRYSLIPITLDGQQISVNPAGEKWTLITDDAYLRANDGYFARVYNIGMLVGQIPSRRAGGAGIIVSRQPLSLNMARNDVIEDDETWKRIGKDMKKLSSEKVEKRKRLSEDDLRNLVQDMRSGDVEHTLELVNRAMLITDTNGRSIKLLDFVNRLQGYTPLMLHDNSSKYGNAHAHEKGFAYVLHPKTLGRWEVETPQELLAAVSAYLLALTRAFPKDAVYRRMHEDLGQQRVVQDLQTLLPEYSDAHRVLSRSERSPSEEAVRQGLKDVIHLINRSVQSARTEMNLPPAPLYQRVDIGQSESRRCWKGEERTLVIEQAEVAAALKSGDQFMRLLLVLSQFAFSAETSDEEKSSKAGITPNHRLIQASARTELDSCAPDLGNQKLN